MRHLILAVILVLGFVPYASAAQLDAKILSGEDYVEPSFQFLRVVYIEYPNGGEISESLRGKKEMVSFVADSNTPGMDEFVMQLNKNLASVPSYAVVTDVQINYQAILQGNENYAVVEYNVQLIPTMTNHVLAKAFEKSTVDANWRGISLDEPVVFQTVYGSFDVNNPKSALDVMIPNVSEKLKDISILELPLIDASGILDLPLDKWHSLFDNTAIMPGADKYGYSGKYIVTHYSMGECSIFLGMCNDREWIQEIDLDEKYTIRIVESRDDATISLEGYVDSSYLDGIEVFETNLNSLVTQRPATNEFPATIMYGMAGMAAIGAGIMFVISNRKLKKDKNEGQTGVDPAQLRSYETSNSAGAYKTNRGESVLVSNEKSKMAIG